MRYHRFEVYENILQFEELSGLEDENLPLNIKDYLNPTLEFNIEQFWLDMYKEKNPTFEKWQNLSSFMVNILLIPHSNADCERVFSQIKLTKTSQRNLLDITTVSYLMQVKTYYDDFQDFEPNNDHYFCYRHAIGKLK
jgi:hypothetical protein